MKRSFSCAIFRVAAAGWIAVLAGTALAFEASDYGTVSLHLRAGDLPNTPNAPVPAWGPLRAAGTSQPTWVASDVRFNQQPVVRFDGNSDVLTLADANLEVHTAFAVLTGENGALNLATLISNGGDGLNLRRNGTSASWRATGAAQDSNDFTGNGTPIGTFQVNGLATTAFTAGTPHLIAAVAGAPKNYSSFWLGNANTSLNRYWRGSVAEVLLYAGTLTPSAMNAVGYYFQEKYGLPTAFTVPDPVIRTFRAVTQSGIDSAGGVMAAAGEAVTLRWLTEGAENITLNPDTISPSAFTGTITVSPSVTTTYTLTAIGSSGVPVTRTLTVHVGVTPAPPRIQEFMADNTEGLMAPDGTFPDWIELYNPNPYGIGLHGLALRDSSTVWSFPLGSSIPAEGYRVVYATGINRTDPAGILETSFSLAKEGEVLELLRTATGEVLNGFSGGYPAQYPDISYGWFGDPPTAGYFGGSYGTPTPGAVNGAGVLGFLAGAGDPQLSAGRGFYQEAVPTTVRSDVPGAHLIYTLNGSTPAPGNGTVVLPADASTPPSFTLTIHPDTVPPGVTGTHTASIGGVTTLRVAAFLDGYAPTSVHTHTFVFPANVLTQTPAKATARGWPGSPVNGQQFNYGMDPAAVAAYSQNEMLESLQSLPSLSIVTDQVNLTGSAAGIYVNADQHGAAWERPVSLELIHPPGYVNPDGNAQGFQTNAGLRIRGGFSRGDSFFKHGLRFYFSGRYSGKLRYPLFGSGGAREFGKLDLGTGSNYAWYRESSYSSGRFNTMVRDPFCRDTQGALGQPHTRSRYYHLYLNGHYWGLYYTEERAEAEYAASYFGGDDDEYDAVKCGNHIGNFQTEATDGTLDAWRNLWNKTRSIATAGATAAKFFELSGKRPDGTRDPAMPVLLDVENLIDEMLVIFFSGDGDAVLSNFLGHDRPNNWFSVYRRNGADGFRFFIRDAEHTLGAPSWVVDQTGPWGGSYVNDFTYSNPQRMHQDLMASPEYKILFADHVRRHFLDGGALTPQATALRWQRRVDQLAKAIKVESARWGDAQSISGLPAGHPPRYTVQDWEAAVASVKNSILPNRTATVLNQLRADGLYPSVAAPSFLTTADAPHYGGSFPEGTTVRITTAGQPVYFTLDGSDPRLPGGAIAPGVITGATPLEVPVTTTTRLKARAWNPENSTWSALTEAVYRTGVPASSANLVISKIHYNPGPGQEEYLELLNVGQEPLDLGGCQFTIGVLFQFPSPLVVPPGGRVLLVRNMELFRAAWPAVPAAQIAGAFAGDTALSNGGEPLELRAANGDVIRSFAYDDAPPWPAAADGTGAPLILNHPYGVPDPFAPAHWRAGAPTVIPGTSDGLRYSDWAAQYQLAPDSQLADPDQDGLVNLVEFALGTRPDTAGDSLPPPRMQNFSPGEGTAPRLYLGLARPVLAEEVDVRVQASSDPSQSWIPALPFSAPILQENGALFQWYYHPEAAAGPRQYLRLQVTHRP